MASVSTIPAVALPKRAATVVFNLSGDTGNFIRVWCTGAPIGSDLDTKIRQDKSSRNRIEVFADDAPVDTDGIRRARWVHSFDKGGKYTLVLQRYTLASDWGGGYEGDVRAYPTDALGNRTKEKLEGGEQTLSLHIAQELTQPIGPPPDAATLLLYVLDSTIVETTFVTHGVESPAIINPAIGRAKAAAESSTVTTLLDGLAGDSVTTAVGDVGAVLLDIIAKQDAHNALTAGSVHANTDTVNAMAPEYESTQAPASLQNTVNTALHYATRHRLNDSGSGLGSAASPYHSPGGTRKADFANLPLFRSAGSPGEVYGATADLYRVHEAHRVSTAVHGAADSTNVLGAIPALMDVHRKFLEVLAAMTPTPPPGQSSGAMTLIARAGFKES